MKKIDFFKKNIKCAYDDGCSVKSNYGYVS